MEHLFPRLIFCNQAWLNCGTWSNGFNFQFRNVLGDYLQNRMFCMRARAQILAAGGHAARLANGSTVKSRITVNEGRHLMSNVDRPVVRLNPNLDRERIARSLQEHRRIQIPEIFPHDVAERLYKCLSAEVTWNTTFSDGDEKVHAMHPTQVSAMSKEQAQWLNTYIQNKARFEYQFVYQNFPLWDLIQKKLASPDLYVFDVARFIDGPEFLEFIRDISGVPTIGMADSQATLFRANHFLTSHTDRDHTYKGRRMAYVLNMTPEWRTEWGGILEFLDEAGNVVEGFKPCFNTLNLFYVPTWHHVSYVAPYAAGGRYSITGWLRDKTTAG